MRGEPHRQKWGKKIASALKDYVQDSMYMRHLIEEYFQPHKNDHDQIQITFNSPFKDGKYPHPSEKSDFPMPDGTYDAQDFLARLGETKIFDYTNSDDPFDFDQWLIDNVHDENDDAFDPSTYSDDGIRSSVEDMLNTEHHKNRAKRMKKSKSHPKESLDGTVGVFPIAYVEYLEKQNDKLRANLNKWNEYARKENLKNGKK